MEKSSHRNNKHSENKQNEKNKSFIHRYRRYFIIFGVVIIIIYFLVYFSFCGNGFISVGKELDKKSWLSFLGSYLSFVGTIAVALVATLQSQFYAERGKRNERKRRHEQIQPIFSIKIQSINTQVDGTVEVFNPYQSSTIVHQNFKLQIKNVGQYPVKHLIIFETYITPLMECNESVTLQCAFSDSPDIKTWPKKLIELPTGEYKQGEEGLPKEFQICYEDIDGASMYQAYSLSKFDSKKYYTLICKEEV